MYLNLEAKHLVPCQRVRMLLPTVCCGVVLPSVHIFLIFVDAMNLAVKQLALLVYTQGCNQLLLARCVVFPSDHIMLICVWSDVEDVADMLDYIIKDSKNFAVKLTVPMPTHKVAAHHLAQHSLSWCGMCRRLERNIVEKAAFFFITCIQLRDVLRGLLVSFISFSFFFVGKGLGTILW